MSTAPVEFRQVHDTYRLKILRYLTRLVGEHEAEDVTQTVFAKVSEGLKNFRGEASLSTWIYRIATNAALDKLRSLATQRGTAVPLPAESTLEDHVDADEYEASADERSASVDSVMIRVEMDECIKGFIKNLPENYRTVIVLGDIEGFKNIEIADILGVSLDTVKIRLYRARQQLKKELEAGCDFYRDERNEFACDHKSEVNPAAK
jgi:RNA polymerase sigma-70 factor (ECF subfamily)